MLVLILDQVFNLDCLLVYLLVARFDMGAVYFLLVGEEELVGVRVLVLEVVDCYLVAFETVQEGCGLLNLLQLLSSNR